MSRSGHDLCPVGLARYLDTPVRRWLQKPERLLAPYVREGMVVLDLGCGPGFFTVPMARMVGTRGHVIACDVQQGMLEKLHAKVRGTELEGRVQLHLCTEDKLGISEAVDFVLAFYVIHEVPDPGQLLAQLATIIRPAGRILVVEPPLHVSRSAFEEFLAIARSSKFTVLHGPRLWFNKTALLQRSEA